MSEQINRPIYPTDWLTTALDVKVFDTIEEAPCYSSQVGRVCLKQANIVKNGMVNGVSTVDLVFEDRNGQLHATIMSANLLRSLLSVVNGADNKLS
jgi:hypothetical protein